MHSLKISACGAMLMLIAPVAAAHPARHGHAHTRATGMKCLDMHAHMHGSMSKMAHQAQSGSGMMHGGMKCMSHRPAKAPPARASKAPSPPQHDHDHTGGQPPK